MPFKLLDEGAFVAEVDECHGVPRVLRHTKFGLGEAGVVCTDCTSETSA